MIELLFIAENFQCGADAPLAQFEIIFDDGGAPVNNTLRVGQSVIVDNLYNVTIQPIANAECMDITIDTLRVDENNIPDLPGLYNQPNVAEYLNDLKGAEEIYLYEFGSVNGDYQDVVIRVDWDYQPKQLLFLD